MTRPLDKASAVPPRSASLTSIAKAAGVSVGTVSRLMRNDPSLRISAARREEILRVTQKLDAKSSANSPANSPANSSANSPAIAPAPVRTKLVNILLPRDIPQVHFQSDVVKSERYIAMEKELASLNITLHYCFYDVSDKHTAFENVMTTSQVDGLVLVWSQCDARLAALLHQHQFPHVTDDYAAENHGVNTVCNHARSGIIKAVEHLRVLGHRQIGWVGPERVYRYPMTLGALAQAGLPINPANHCFLERDWNKPIEDLRLVAQLAMHQWLDQPTDATAFLCANDHVAMGVVDALNDRGLSAGQQYSVVGYDNIEEQTRFGVTTPMLTTISNPMAPIGKRMAQLLANQILHKQLQIVHERIPAQLFVHTSTGKCPVNSPA